MRAPEIRALTQLLAVGACLVAACYRDAPGTEPSNHAQGAPNDDELAYLPRDSQLVFGFDVARMRGSPLWSRFEPLIATEMKSELEMIRTSCGFDPTQTVQRVAIGFKSQGRDESGVLVVRGVETSHMLACVADEFGKLGDTITDRGVVIRDPRSRDASAWTVVGTDTLVVQVGRGVNHDSIAAVVANGAPLRSSPIFMAIYDHLERGASAWGVANGASSTLDFFEDVRPRTVDGTIATTDRVTIAVRFKLATPAAATKLAEMITKDLSEAPFLTRRDAVVSGASVKVDIMLTSDQVAAALALVGVH